MTEDTFPKLLLRNYGKWGDQRIAMRKKTFGMWLEYTWKDYYEQVKYLSLALVSLGFKREDKMSIIGDNAPEWFWAELAAQAAGGQVVGVYPDSSPAEVKYIVGHSDSKVVVAEDQEQLDKLLEIKDELPLMKKVIYWDAKGLNNYDEPILMSWKEAIELGKSYEQAHPAFFEQMVDQGKADDLCLLFYTSGTSGLPKGVMISNRNIMITTKRALQAEPYRETDNEVSYVNPSWLTEQSFGVNGPLVAGNCVNFIEEPETAQSDIREIGPQVVFYSSKLWESLESRIEAAINDANPFKRFIYYLILPIGYKKADLSLQKKKVPLFWRVLGKIGYWVMFRPLQDQLGVRNARVGYTAGMILGPDIFRFFHAIGINLLAIYASTEAGMISGHKTDDIKVESVGRPFD